MRNAISGVLLVALAASQVIAQEPVGTPRQGAPAQDGTVTMDQVEVPLSNLLSPEGAEYLRHLIVDKPFDGGPGAAADIVGERAHQDRIMKTFLEPMLARYAVDIEEQRIGGIVVDVVTPAEGVAPENRHRVLLNVHGGGFVSGARSASLVESVPLAAIMKIKVISIDYRMGPEFQFPAASEDVEAVYREVLKTYDPSHIVLYGCSAGGMLTAQSTARLQSKGLPNPAAIGVFCASLGQFFAGDSAILSGPLNGRAPFPRGPVPGAAADGPPQQPRYMDTAMPDDPLAFPLVSPELLAKFPPTLFITGTRAFEFSAALDSHNRLTRAGVESRFHGWDGMFHGSFYNSELPESREAYKIMAHFFDEHMAD